MLVPAFVDRTVAVTSPVVSYVVGLNGSRQGIRGLLNWCSSRIASRSTKESTPERSG
jgi:hypothetical protein